ncbi:HNH endonuclease [Paracoccus sulfuroxidans]|uniref:Colicin-lik bacteriocin with DNase/tRNase domain n=1 Tax=Paracoccus sulfuroxidans TaxID=384678 RepID=A0A562NU75_9RHOB|nr:HNH endonuclease [Paracoccus sulfuroxidans]TWI35673.1 colicin-lik bacteriocin with DNase/tRNase domain [Paracoccus sulfuroxidans]
MPALRPLSGRQTRLQNNPYMSVSAQQALTGNKPAPLIVDGNKGKTTMVGNNMITIGDPPKTWRRQKDDQPQAQRVDGTTVTVNQPKSNVTWVMNPDGSKVGTSSNISEKVTYDPNGFPVFQSKADVYLDPKHINTKDSVGHFKAANEAVQTALKGDPRLAGRMGLSQQQRDDFLQGRNFNSSPADLTWHHHQNMGLMKLVDRAPHAAFKHTGGMATWGGGRS